MIAVQRNAWRTVLAVVTVFALGACDGSIVLQGMTSETVFGNVSDGIRPLSRVEVYVSLRERGAAHPLGVLLSNDGGRYDFRTLSSPYSGASSYIIEFRKDGYESVRIDLAEPLPDGVEVARCPEDAPRATVCRVIDVTMRPGRRQDEPAVVR